MACVEDEGCMKQGMQLKLKALGINTKSSFCMLMPARMQEQHGEKCKNHRCSHFFGIIRLQLS